jgi:hypothetical protein
MPIDPSIALSGSDNLLQPINPMDAATKYQGLANAQAQNQQIQASTASTQAGTAQTNQNIAISAKLQQAKGLGEWLNLPDNMRTQNAARQLTDDNLRRGIITPQEHDVSTQTINNTTSQAQLDEIAHQGIIHLMTGTERQRQIFGNPILPNIGGSLVPFLQNQNTGAITPAGQGVRNTLTPGETANRITAVGAGGTRGTVSQGSVSDPYGNDKGAAPIGGDGSYKGAAAPGATTTPATTPSGANPPGFMATDTPPDFKANQDAYLAAKGDIPAATNRIADLTKASHALQLIDSGRGTAGLQQLKQFLVAEGVAGADTIKSVNDYAMAKKLTLNYASNLPGVRSDQSLTTQIAANANTDIPNGAAIDITNTNIGKERMAVAQAMSHNDPTGQGYLSHGQNFSSTMDRRAFSIDMMPPAALNTMVSKMSAPEKQKFLNSLEVAKKYHLLSMPQ